MKSEVAAPVSQLLKRRRQNRSLSLADVEVATKIRGKYLTAFESGDYHRIPNDIYTRGFISSYAQYLGLEPDEVVRQYTRDRGGPVTEGRHRAPEAVARPRVVVTTRLLAVAMVGLIAITIIGYLIWQFSALAAPPQLTVTTPAGDQVIYGNQLNLSGHATNGADVLVNDSAILTDANGNFADQLALQEGVNVIHITARDKLGKSTIVTRNVLAHLPQLDPALLRVPVAPFDGIAVAIAIKTSATALTVMVDGQIAFNGTMLAGTTQLFKGAQTIVITTSNAGSTNLTLTNAVAANVSIAPAGRAGTVLRNLTFAKDTVVQ